MSHPVVSREEWLEARRALLVQEKEATRQRDRLNQARLALPWVKLDKAYAFDELVALSGQSAPLATLQ